MQVLYNRVLDELNCINTIKFYSCEVVSTLSVSTVMLRKDLYTIAVIRSCNRNQQSLEYCDAVVIVITEF